MTYENISGIIGVILQAIVAVIAWKALSVWKSEIRGRDKYKLSKDLLEYIKKIRFLVHTDKGSLHQIYLNDILVNKKEFYKKQLSLIAKEKVYFDENYMNLFDHINIRSNIFLQKMVGCFVLRLCPCHRPRPCRRWPALAFGYFSRRLSRHSLCLANSKVI